MFTEPKESYVYRAKYLANYDGDTIDFEVDLGFNVKMKMRTRLMGLDCPEMRGGTDVEKAAAREAQTFVKNAVGRGADFTTEIKVRTFKDGTEKYGRYLAEVWYRVFEYCDRLRPPPDFKCLNQELLDNGLAVPMEG